MAKPFFTPDWPTPANVRSLSTVRTGGVSASPYDSFNLATHVDDSPQHVTQNRSILMEHAELADTPRWLNQIHGTKVINSLHWYPDYDADGIFSNQIGHICTIMTADCLPVLLCDRQGSFVAAVHAGWRGLLNGIIENAIAKYPGNISDLMVWLGPAIGPEQFEVGRDVYQQFCNASPEARQAFKQTDSEHYLADIYLLAHQRIMAMGINSIYGGSYCTVSDKQRFFSYRRDRVTGRMASMIWLTDK